MASAADTPEWIRHDQVLAQRQPFQAFEYAYRHPDGSTRCVRINGRPVYDGKGRFVGYRGTGTDATREVVAGREVEARGALQGAAFEAMAQGICVFDAGLTMVAFNRRFVELLDLPADPLHDGDSFADIMRYNAAHPLEVINDILDLARVEAGKVILELLPLAPRAAVDDCFRMPRHRALEAGVELRNEAPEQAPILLADHQRLRQILLNLVGDAIKFSGTGSEVLLR